MIIVKPIPDFFCNSYQGMVCRKFSFVKAFGIFKNSFILEWIKAFIFFRHKNKIDQDTKWLRENIFVKFKKLKKDTIWTCCFFILNLLPYWWFNFIYCGSWEENSIFNWFFYNEIIFPSTFPAFVLKNEWNSEVILRQLQAFRIWCFSWFGLYQLTYFLLYFLRYWSIPFVIQVFADVFL